MIRPLSEAKSIIRAPRNGRGNRETIPVTVCVAAICQNGAILGAADRMLTGGDIEFEPPQAKIQILTNSIAGMVAGDSALQAEIIRELRLEIDRRVAADPKQWLSVSDVASWYSEFSRQARGRRIERAILSPLGLNRETFISRQRELNPELLSKLATEMLTFEAAKTQMIVAGLDTEGPHIYIVSDGDVSCQDGVGFAAIGAGYWHADSQFMFARHTSWKPLPETLLLTYAAKKRAEVAPGVGRATDMFSIGPTLGSFMAIPRDLVNHLDVIYRRTRTESAEIVTRANREVTAYVKQVVAEAEASAKEQEATPDSDRAQTTDQENAGNGNVPAEIKPKPN